MVYNDTVGSYYSELCHSEESDKTKYLFFHDMPFFMTFVIDIVKHGVI